MIDDASSEWTARFALSDSTAENRQLLWRYLEQHGRPVDFYTDKASLFTINRPLHCNKHLPEESGKTQLGPALEELGIGWIAAHSPQAKGRIERCFGTLQDRLVKALRRAGANRIEEANRYRGDAKETRADLARDSLKLRGFREPDPRPSHHKKDGSWHTLKYKDDKLVYLFSGRDFDRTMFQTTAIGLRRDEAVDRNAELNFGTAR